MKLKQTTNRHHHPASKVNQPPTNSTINNHLMMLPVLCIYTRTRTRTYDNNHRTNHNQNTLATQRSVHGITNIKHCISCSTSVVIVVVAVAVTFTCPSYSVVVFAFLSMLYLTEVEVSCDISSVKCQFEFIDNMMKCSMKSVADNAITQTTTIRAITAAKSSLCSLTLWLTLITED
uniref:Transmembrane protein n=1 Tax=Glossina brevipalpis TaxID=37001 RepID=A0A1A9X1M9_9MUSC